MQTNDCTKKRRQRGPSDTNKAYLKTIQEYIGAFGYPPSLRDLATLMGVSSPGTVHRQLSILKERRLLTQEPEKPRTLALTDEGKQLLGIGKGA